MKRGRCGAFWLGVAAVRAVADAVELGRKVRQVDPSRWVGDPSKRRMPSEWWDPKGRRWERDHD